MYEYLTGTRIVLEFIMTRNGRRADQSENCPSGTALQREEFSPFRSVITGLIKVWVLFILTDIAV